MRFTLRPAKQAAKVLEPKGGGPGAQLTPGATVRSQPTKLPTFVHYDPQIAAQRQRAAVKASFGKRAPVMALVPAFDPRLRVIVLDHEPVEKSMADVAAWTTKTGKTVSLKAKAAPIKAVIAGEDLSHAAPKVKARHAKITRTARATAGTKRFAGTVLREIGYRPDYAGIAATKLLSAPSLIASHA